MSRPPRILDPDRAALVVVDVQEAFRPAVLGFEQVAANVARLVEGAAMSIWFTAHSCRAFGLPRTSGTANPSKASS